MAGRYGGIANVKNMIAQGLCYSERQFFRQAPAMMWRMDAVSVPGSGLRRERRQAIVSMFCLLGIRDSCKEKNQIFTAYSRHMTNQFINLETTIASPDVVGL